MIFIQEKSCQEARQQLQLQSESIAKEQNELKNLLEKQEGVILIVDHKHDSYGIQIQVVLDSMTTIEPKTFVK